MDAGSELFISRFSAGVRHDGQVGPVANGWGEGALYISRLRMSNQKLSCFEAQALCNERIVGSPQWGPGYK